MPITRKQKKARKSSEVDMLSDIENLDIMLGGNHLEREKVQLVIIVEGLKAPFMTHCSIKMAILTVILMKQKLGLTSRTGIVQGK